MNTNIYIEIHWDYIFTGFLQRFGHLPSFYLILLILRRICPVRFESRQKVLHETILALRMDSRGITNRCESVLSDYQEYFRRTHLVHSTGLDDHLQWHYGIRFWIFLRKNTSNSSVAQEDMGRIYRWRVFNCHIWIPSKYKCSNSF